MTHPVGVVGASARAAVHSLARAGFAAWAVDLFADRDLTGVVPCAVCPLADYPAALPRLAAAFPPGPVLYTGGLENHPEVVAELAAGRDLWGNPPAVLERVRDPFRLFPALAAAGFAVPRILPWDAVPPTGERWLVKLPGSSGGAGVRFSRPGVRRPGFYQQEFIDGPSLSAVYRGGELLGITEQLVGVPWLRARPFAYAGSVGPVAVSDRVRGELVRLGDELHRTFGVRGVWNVDFIVRDDAPYPVEVNPRYTASVEVLEHAAGAAVLASGDREVAGNLSPPATSRSPLALCGPTGKAIYYAPHALTFPASGPWDADLAGDFDPWRLPVFADIPAPGTAFGPGHPVITMLVSGSSPAACRERLQSRAADLDRLLAETPR